MLLFSYPYNRKHNIFNQTIPIMTFGATEIILIVAIIVLFFGAKKIPELARGIGQGINEFQKVSDNTETGNNKESKE